MLEQLDSVKCLPCCQCIVRRRVVLVAMDGECVRCHLLVLPGHDLQLRKAAIPDLTFPPQTWQDSMWQDPCAKIGKFVRNSLHVTDADVGTTGYDAALDGRKNCMLLHHKSIA